MKEKAILAYFHSPEEANALVPKLQALRIADYSIDRISRYPGNPVQEPVNPITGNITGLSGLVLDATETNASTGILMASDPSASGLSHGGAGGPTGRDILLTVVIDEENHRKAIRLIEEAGGVI